MKKSSGVLLWKKENNICYVLLAHFGGPYLKDLDIGAWSLQKGIVENNEKVFDAAKRESFEETNLVIGNEIDYLASKKVSKKKLVIMFESYFDGDITNFKSNTFKIEFPRNSGVFKEYPEMNEIKWFSIDEAKKYIHPSQTFFINRLEDIIKNNRKGR